MRQHSISLPNHVSNPFCTTLNVPHSTHSRSTHSRSTHSRSTHSRSTHSRSTYSRSTQFTRRSLLTPFRHNSSLHHPFTGCKLLVYCMNVTICNDHKSNLDYQKIHRICSDLTRVSEFLYYLQRNQLFWSFDFKKNNKWSSFIKKLFQEKKPMLWIIWKLRNDLCSIQIKKLG